MLKHRILKLFLESIYTEEESLSFGTVGPEMVIDTVPEPERKNVSSMMTFKGQTIPKKSEPTIKRLQTHFNNIVQILRKITHQSLKNEKQIISDMRDYINNVLYSRRLGGLPPVVSRDDMRSQNEKQQFRSFIFYWLWQNYFKMLPRHEKREPFEFHRMLSVDYKDIDYVTEIIQTLMGRFGDEIKKSFSEYRPIFISLNEKKRSRLKKDKERKEKKQGVS